MADVKFEVARVSLSTAASGTQDITISGFGTPKAAMFIMASASTDDTITASSTMSIGWTDGTNENCVYQRIVDGSGTSTTSRGYLSNAVLAQGANTSTWVRFGFNSWITDGVRLDIDDATTTAHLLTVILIGGSDVSNAHVGYHDDIGAGGTTEDITSIGFEPDLVFLAANGLNTTPPAYSTTGRMSFGVGHNDGSDTQAVITATSDHAASVARATSVVANDAILSFSSNDSGEYATAAIGSYDASGFSLTTTGTPYNALVFYLCLKFTNSPDIKLFDMSWPTSGNYAETTPGFTPDFGLIGSIQGPGTRNTVQSTDNFGWALSAFDDSNVYTVCATEEDGLTTTNSQSLSSDQLRILDNDGATDAVLASSYAFDSSGWDFTLSTNPAAAVLGFGLAIGSGGAGGPTIPIFDHHYRMMH